MTQRFTWTIGCPNGCRYCHEPGRITEFEEIPDASTLPKKFIIDDMNFLYHPKALDLLRTIEQGHYEFQCGIDYRRLTQEIVDLMKEKGFRKPRWAWDYSYSQQGIHQRISRMFIKAGYKPKEGEVFVLVNWAIPPWECNMKLDTLKVWGRQVSDCCYDGGYKTPAEGFWTAEERKDFRRRCRKHNQLIRHGGIDPEWRGSPEQQPLKGEWERPASAAPRRLSSSITTTQAGKSS